VGDVLSQKYGKLIFDLIELGFFETDDIDGKFNYRSHCKLAVFRETEIIFEISHICEK